MTDHRVWVYGSNVNTDVIFPGKYTYKVRDPKDFAAHALEDLDPSFAPNAQAGDVIVAGRNWGCGSSREQAVIALKYAGVVAIIAESFNGLYFRNCVNQGVLPIVCEGLAQVTQTGDSIALDVARGEIRAGDQRFTFAPPPPSVQAILDEGGLLPMLQKRFRKEVI
ncbi:MAG: 3-isopropylmalate dehydratase small subunit [Chloroflexi bacterium OLB15]|nr:MAG: 3-isopropylmalate dehydratase small subunit [Chloroflexi bacterium OLB15]